MTQRDIVNTYLTYKHRKRTLGEREDNTLPLMPFFIMDVCYQIYCKDIKNIPCKHLMKQAKTRWNESYHKFTSDFFRAFNQDQTDYIVDLMDEFNDYIHNYVVMLKSSVMNHISGDASFEDKKILGALMVCNVLAQSAQILYGEMFRSGTKVYEARKINAVITVMPKESDPYIDAVRKASYDIARLYPTTKGVDLTASDKVMGMVHTLCTNIIKFLKEKENGN
jgi:hypothetical protein